MKPDDRTRALNAAAVHLGWLTAEPWTRAATALDVLADVDRRVVIAAGSRDGTGRQKRLTADQLQHHQLDITDLRRDPA